MRFVQKYTIRRTRNKPLAYGLAICPYITGYWRNDKKDATIRPAVELNHFFPIT